VHPVVVPDEKDLERPTVAGPGRVENNGVVAGRGEMIVGDPRKAKPSVLPAVRQR
jgi:hypothetical protein